MVKKAQMQSEKMDDLKLFGSLAYMAFIQV